MRVFAIALLLITVAVPYAMWVRKTALPQVNWKKLEQSLGPVIAESGLRNCSDQEITANLLDLCKKSASNWIPNGIGLQKRFAGLFLRCQINPGSATVQIEPYEEASSDALVTRKTRRAPAHAQRPPEECSLSLSGPSRVFQFDGGGHLKSRVAP